MNQYFTFPWQLIYTKKTNQSELLEQSFAEVEFDVWIRLCNLARPAMLTIIAIFLINRIKLYVLVVTLSLGNNIKFP